jgi:hypothetical protein
MRVRNNHNIVEVPENDTNHCKYCKERLGKRYIIEGSKFYCNINCLSGYLSFLIKYDTYENNRNSYMVNALYAIIGIVLLVLIIRSF